MDHQNIKQQAPPPTDHSHNSLSKDFIEKLASAEKAVQFNFISKKTFSVHRKPKEKEQEENPEGKPTQASPYQKSIYNTKSVFLPALKQKKLSNQYHQKLVINDSIFIHERIPLSEPKKTPMAQENNKIKSKPFPQLRSNLQPYKQEKKPAKPSNSSSSPLHAFSDIEIIELSATEIIKLDKIQSPKRNRLNHYLSNDKITRESQQPSRDTPKQESLKVIKPEPITIDASELQHNKKKSKIEKMIVYYQLRRAKAEEKAISQKNIISEAFDKMDNINIKGEHTLYFSKKESPGKKRQLIVKERSLSELVKIKDLGWKSKKFPISDLSKIEISRLFAFYLSIKQANPIPSGNYKVYVGDGNNGQLIARIFRNKGWWVPTEDIKQAHVVWTQHPSLQLMKKLPSSNIIKLNPESALTFALPSNQQLVEEKEQLKKFLKHKSNNFLRACAKILHPTLYHKTITELFQRFKDNKVIKNYQNIRDAAGRFISISPSLTIESKDTVIFNHCEFSEEVGDKKKLLFHIEKYCQLQQIDKNKLIPNTLHLDQNDIEEIKRSNNRQEVLKNKLNSLGEEETLYILKPGESTNRGNGISIHPSKSALITHITSSITTFPESKTYIAQQYIDPLLYDNRKFDIRVWALYCNNKLWFYREGYIRTSCKQYTTKNMNKYIHLTNDAVQKNSDEYGKYEPANKVSFQDLDKYLKKTYNYEGFYSQIYTQIKNLTKILFEAGMLVIGRTSQQFQLFGLDFLIDKQFNVWLIECNTNPSIEICCSLLTRLIPNLIDNVITIAIDPYFQPNERKIVRQQSEWAEERFNFQLLSDATIETDYLKKAMQDKQYFNYLCSLNPHKLGELAMSEESTNE